jgi:transcriptional antiterminator NusG
LLVFFHRLNVQKSRAKISFSLEDKNAPFARKNRYDNCVTSTGTHRWYALAVNSGQEKRIRERIFNRLEKSKINTRGITIVCPEEEVIIESEGKDPERKKRMSLPGYLLIYGGKLPETMVVEMNRVSGVLGFLGSGERPTPLKDEEVEKLVGQEGGSKKKGTRMFNPGDGVTIIEGPMTDFSGTILSVSETEAQIEVEIFGRSTKTSAPLRSLRRD